MKCPECVKEGKRSTVLLQSVEEPLLYYARQWDEEGNETTVQPRATKSYTCSNGHKWTETT